MYSTVACMDRHMCMGGILYKEDGNGGILEDANVPYLCIGGGNRAMFFFRILCQCLDYCIYMSIKNEGFNEKQFWLKYYIVVCIPFDEVFKCMYPQPLVHRKSICEVASWMRRMVASWKMPLCHTSVSVQETWQ